MTVGMIKETMNRNLKIEIYDMSYSLEILPSAAVLWSIDRRSWELILSWLKFSLCISWKSKGEYL